MVPKFLLAGYPKYKRQETSTELSVFPFGDVEELLDLALVAGLDVGGLSVALLEQVLLQLHHAPAVPLGDHLVVHHGAGVVFADDATGFFLDLK